MIFYLKGDKFELKMDSIYMKKRYEIERTDWDGTKSNESLLLNDPEVCFYRDSLYVWSPVR